MLFSKYKYNNHFLSIFYSQVAPYSEDIVKYRKHKDRNGGEEDDEILKENKQLVFLENIL